MTRIADLKKRLMNDPAFQKEYEKADAEFATIEALIRARSALWVVISLCLSAFST